MKQQLMNEYIVENILVMYCGDDNDLKLGIVFNANERKHSLIVSKTW